MGESDTMRKRISRAYRRFDHRGASQKLPRICATHIAFTYAYAHLAITAARLPGGAHLVKHQRA